MDTKDNNNSDHSDNLFIGPSERYQLDSEIFGEELDAINSRRRTYGQPEVLNQPEGPDEHDDSVGKPRPSSSLGLVGLAFSGGGIRSSTVNIGLIQGLGKSAAIERIDYLSTVSGGGFAGGCLSTTVTNAPIHTNSRVRIQGLPDGARIHGATPDKGGDWLVDQLLIKVDLPPVSTDVKCQILAFVDEESLSEPQTRLSVSMADNDEVSWHKISPDGTAWGIDVEQASATTVTLSIAREPFPFAFRRPPHAPESAAMQHLREFADYLKPHRAFSALRIPALFLMGFTTNFFVLLPLLLAIAAVTYVIWSDEIEHALCTNSSELVLMESDFDKDGTKVIQLERYLVPPETCDQNTRKAVWVNLMNVPSRAHVQDLPGCKIQNELSNRTQTILKCDPSNRPQRRVKIGLAAFDDPFEDDLEITIRSWATPKPRKVYHPTYWPQRCANNRQLALNQYDFDERGRYEVELKRYLVPPKTCSPTKGSKVLLDLVNLPLSSLVNGVPGACTIVDDGSGPSHTRLECDPDPEAMLLIDPGNFGEALREHPQITVEARWNDHTFETDPISALTDSTFNVVLAFLWLFVLMMVAYPLWKIPTHWGTRDTITRMFGGALLLLLAITAIELQPLGTYYFASAVGAPKSGTLLGNFGDAAVFLMVSATVIGGLVARSSAAKKFGGTLLMYAVAILGFLTLWLVAAYFTLWLLDCTHVPGIDMLSTGPAHDSLYGFFKFLNVIQPDRWIYFTDPTQCSLQQPSTELAFTYFVLVLLLLWITRHRFNINKTSFHHFYRDRLSRAFSFNPWGKSLEHVEDVPLEGLATDRGPLHILNATLNLPSTKIGSLKGRRCDFFTFTPLRVGGQLTGYVRTRDYAQAERGFDLISAMAVSGAAAAPTMGIYTNRALVFLMALLNVRLDFWAHNPNLHARPPVKVGTVGAAYLAREMFGMLDETEPFINLSDGGHLENLGVYELIRRHCKLIICSDCQADEGMMFDGLADLIRMVRIDMGIEIDIDVDVLKRAEGKTKSEAGLSMAHFAVGTIDYGDDEENGVLIYIKASLTGDEGLYIDNYRSDHPSFPNETTADQFFDEPQFEAYRSLGQHIAVEFLKSDVARSWLANDRFDANEILKSARGR